MVTYLDAQKFGDFLPYVGALLIGPEYGYEGHVPV